MINRTVVIRRNTLLRQPNTKRKYNLKPKTPSVNAAGFISPVFVVLACMAFSGLFYMYSVNQTAVKGLAIRNAEREIIQQQKDFESLKIKEAELKSLYHIEDSSRQLEMIDSINVKYLEEIPTVAFNVSK
ncbi:MAG: hypothetical protein ACD_5C00213G0002 [uncultured bacterium]|nr:MAG: hypothetical protein ACD_5C00213G0002 [uncultured bacterium]